MPETGPFFHGGYRGLEPGDALLPASETGALSVSGTSGAPYRRDRIYLAETIEEARSYAALYISPATLLALAHGKQITIADFGGDLYEIEALGPVTPDGDYSQFSPGLSWETTAARVSKVLERGVPAERSVVEGALGRLKSD